MEMKQNQETQKVAEGDYRTQRWTSRGWHLLSQGGAALFAPGICFTSGDNRYNFTHFTVEETEGLWWKFACSKLETVQLTGSYFTQDLVPKPVIF